MYIDLYIYKDLAPSRSFDIFCDIWRSADVYLVWGPRVVDSIGPNVFACSTSLHRLLNRCDSWSASRTQIPDILTVRCSFFHVSSRSLDFDYSFTNRDRSYFACRTVFSRGWHRHLSWLLHVQGRIRNDSLQPLANSEENSDLSLMSWKIEDLMKFDTRCHVVQSRFRIW